MRKLKVFAALFCAAILSLSFNSTAMAADVNIDEWNTDSTLYDVLDYSTESNCAVEYAFLRVKYDRPSNRIRLLFMLELSSFSVEENAGVTMSINGDEKITLHLDGKAEYNKDKYFAEIKSISDPRAKFLYLEVTLGIKQGIPDKVLLDFNVYDTEGAASNTYSIDITENTAVPDTTTQTEKTEKTTKTKTKTEKTKTKAKTKANTSATKAVTSETSEETQVTLTADENKNSETRVNETNTVAIISAVALAASCIGAGAVFFFRNKKN